MKQNGDRSVLEDAGGCQFRFSGSEHVWNRSLVSLLSLLRRSHHQLHHHDPNAPRRRRRTMFSVEKFSAVLLSSHVEIAEATSAAPGFFLSFSAIIEKKKKCCLYISQLSS